MIFSEKEILERTYDMKARVERNESYVTEWNETKTGWVIKYPDIPCTVQRATRRNSTQTTTVNQIEYDSVLIHSPDYLLQSGDKIIVTFANGLTSEFTTGEPYYFESHHEIPLVKEGEA